MASNPWRFCIIDSVPTVPPQSLSSVVTCTDTDTDEDTRCIKQQDHRSFSKSKVWPSCRIRGHLTPETSIQNGDSFHYYCIVVVCTVYIPSFWLAHWLGPCASVMSWWWICQGALVFLPSQMSINSTFSAGSYKNYVQLICYI